MKKLKDLFIVLFTAFFLFMILWLIREMIETKKALPYKTTFYEYQQASYYEFIFYTFLKQYQSKDLRHIQFSENQSVIEDSIINNEQRAYEKICIFPQKYEDLVIASEKLHNEIIELRKAREKNFINIGKKDLFENWRNVYRNISNEYIDCSIISKEEYKRMNRLKEKMIKNEIEIKIEEYKCMNRFK